MSLPKIHHPEVRKPSHQRKDERWDLRVAWFNDLDWVKLGNLSNLCSYIILCPHTLVKEGLWETSKKITFWY